MSDTFGHNSTTARILLWMARLTAIAAIVPLMLIVFGESGSGPAGPREWAYLALFPFGFSAGYILGWRWPVVGGCISLFCMLASQVVIGRTFDLGAYLIWGALSVPAILYVIAGWKLRSASGRVPIMAG
jgi:hypothetical protein